MLKKSHVAFFLFLFIILAWGSSWPINKIGLSYTSPTNYIELRFLFATLTIFLIALLTKNLVLPRKKDLPIIVTVGLFQMGVMLSFANYGLYLIGAGRATFLTYTTSIWILPLGALVFRKRLKGLDYLSLTLGVVGVFLLMRPWTIDWRQDRNWVGDASLLLASLCWAIGILCARHLTWHRPTLQLLPWQLLVATLYTAIIAYFTGVSFIPQHPNLILISTLIYTGSLTMAIGYWAMIIVSKELDPSLTSLGLIGVPVISLILSSFFLDEKVTFRFMGAIILIIGGIVFHIFSEKKAKKQEPPQEENLP